MSGPAPNSDQRMGKRSLLNVIENNTDLPIIYKIGEAYNCKRIQITT